MIRRSSNSLKFSFFTKTRKMSSKKATKQSSMRVHKPHRVKSPFWSICLRKNSWIVVPCLAGQKSRRSHAGMQSRWHHPWYHCAYRDLDRPIPSPTTARRLAAPAQWTEPQRGPSEGKLMLPGRALIRYLAHRHTTANKDSCRHFYLFIFKTFFIFLF